MRTIAVVLAGGRGTRLWPLSTPERPKQLLEVHGKALVAHAVARLQPLGDVAVLTAPDLLDATFAAVPHARVLLEPAPRGTGPAVALALALAEKQGADVVIVTPADHLIADEGAFRDTLAEAVGAARATGEVVVLGIAAEHAATGFGWIEAPPGGGARPVTRFVEKPDRDRAAELLAAGAAWNAGVFVVPLAARAAVERRLPGALAAARAWLGADPRGWTALAAASFDRAYLEHEPSRVVSCACGWSDVGTFEALGRTWPAMGGGNHVVAGAARAVDAHGCFVWAPGRQVALVGVRDVIVIDANGVLLVAAAQEGSGTVDC